MIDFGSFTYLDEFIYFTHLYRDILILYGIVIELDLLFIRWHWARDFTCFNKFPDLSNHWIGWFPVSKSSCEVWVFSVRDRGTRERSLNGWQEILKHQLRPGDFIDMFMDPQLIWDLTKLSTFLTFSLVLEVLLSSHPFRCLCTCSFRVWNNYLSGTWVIISNLQRKMLFNTHNLCTRLSFRLVVMIIPL